MSSFQRICHCLTLVLLIAISFSSYLASATRDIPSGNATANGTTEGGGGELICGGHKCPPVTTILVFGDSSVDPGNNNKLLLTHFKSNFCPYGKDFKYHKATGRFCNGRILSDMIAEHLGIKENVPAYLDRKICSDGLKTLCTDDLKSGVSFASAGSGFDPLTSMLTQVISMKKQLAYLKEYKLKLTAAIGPEKTTALVNNAMFICSSGMNDIVINYFTFPLQRLHYTLPAYVDFLLHEARCFVQDLIDQGAHRVGVAGLPNLGCLPAVITLFSGSPILNRECVSNFSSIAQDYNKRLQGELKDLTSKNSGVQIEYLDIFKPMEDMTVHCKNGFTQLRGGCCGTGLLEIACLCNPFGMVCKDTNKFVFWDSMHPTERAYSYVFESIRPTIDALAK